MVIGVDKIRPIGPHSQVQAEDLRQGERARPFSAHAEAPALGEMGDDMRQRLIQIAIARQAEHGAFLAPAFRHNPAGFGRILSFADARQRPALAFDGLDMRFGLVHMVVQVVHDIDDAVADIGAAVFIQPPARRVELG